MYLLRAMQKCVEYISRDRQRAADCILARSVIDDPGWIPFIILFKPFTIPVQ